MHTSFCLYNSPRYYQHYSSHFTALETETHIYDCTKSHSCWQIGPCRESGHIMVRFLWSSARKQNKLEVGVSGVSTNDAGNRKKCWLWSGAGGVLFCRMYTILNPQAQIPSRSYPVSCRHGSSGRASAWKVQGLEVKPQYCQSCTCLRQEEKF
jgi:hypothetical protein